jgi:hypothetical protein
VRTAHHLKDFIAQGVKLWKNGRALPAISFLGSTGILPVPGVSPWGRKAPRLLPPSLAFGNTSGARRGTGSARKITATIIWPDFSWNFPMLAPYQNTFHYPDHIYNLLIFLRRFCFGKIVVILEYRF